jgi:hypothetical protein
MNLQEAAVAAGVTTRTLQNYIKARRLPAVKHGRTLEIDPMDLRAAFPTAEDLPSPLVALQRQVARLADAVQQQVAQLATLATETELHSARIQGLMARQDRQERMEHLLLTLGDGEEQRRKLEGQMVAALRTTGTYLAALARDVAFLTQHLGPTVNLWSGTGFARAHGVTAEAVLRALQADGGLPADVFAYGHGDVVIRPSDHVRVVAAWRRLGEPFDPCQECPPEGDARESSPR